MIYGVRPYLRTVSPLSLEGALEAREFIRVRLHKLKLSMLPFTVDRVITVPVVNSPRLKSRA